MGGALVRAACRSIGPEQVVIANRTAAKAEALAAETGCTAAGVPEAAAGAGYIFLGVKPHMMQGLLESIAPVLTEGQVLVSMAAGRGDAHFAHHAQHPLCHRKGNDCPVRCPRRG